MEEKVALILPGGGMRCAYGAGFLTALGELGYKKPDILIGASGSAGGSAYFLAEQYSSIRRIWTTLLSTPKFISLLRRPTMDIDYLIDEVFKKQEPLHVERVWSAKIRVLIPIASLVDGSVRYADQHEEADFFEVLRAAKALPIIFGKQVMIRGVPFVDGQVVSSTTDYIDKALAEGATKIILVGNSTMSLRDRVVLRAYSLGAHPALKKSIRKRLHTVIKEIVPPQHAELLSISPSKKLSAGLLTRSSKKLQEAFDVGYKDAVTNKRLHAILLP